MLHLILASASPRRRELLSRLGIPFQVIPSDFTELREPEEEASAYALRNARGKGRNVCEALGSIHKPAIIVAADTIVVCSGEVLEKPKDRDDARRMMRLLSGKTHQAITAVCLLRCEANGRSKIEAEWVDSVDVKFRDLFEDEIERYIATTEPYDKSGAYGITETATSFISSIHGSYTAVMGLPLAQCATFLFPWFRDEEKTP